MPGGNLSLEAELKAANYLSYLKLLLCVCIFCLSLSLSLGHCWPSLGVLNNLRIPDEELEKISVNFNVTKTQRGNCILKVFLFLAKTRMKTLNGVTSRTHLPHGLFDNQQTHYDSVRSETFSRNTKFYSHPFPDC